MGLCINPQCSSGDRQHPDTATVCDRCGSELNINDTYRAKRLLSGQSGFGLIYEVEDHIGCTKVLKILKPEFNQNPRTVSLFQQEAYIIGKIDFPGLPKIEAYLHHDLRNGTILHGLLMEKIEGNNLHEWMKAHHNKPISQRIAIAWLRQIVLTLQMVHKEGYFHRDIKPSNIMLKPSGQLVLIDFGAAREATYTYLAKVGGLGGVTQITSRGYTAPEQELGFAVFQSDFYSLGMTFIHLLTGKHPLEMHDATTNTYDWRDDAPQISSAFGDLIDRLIAVRPAERPLDCAAILHCLDEIENQLKQQQQSITQVKEISTNNKQVAIGIAIALIGCLVLGIGAYTRFIPSASNSSSTNTQPTSR